jgi:hypothetical protein
MFNILYIHKDQWFIFSILSNFIFDKSDYQKGGSNLLPSGKFYIYFASNIFLCFMVFLLDV